MVMKCTNCGQNIAKEDANIPCSMCQSLDRDVSIKDSIHGFELIGIKAKDNNRDLIFKSKEGEEISKKGKLSKVLFKIDRRDPEVTTKTHIVKQKDNDGKWGIVHLEMEQYPVKHRPENDSEK